MLIDAATIIFWVIWICCSSSVITCGDLLPGNRTDPHSTWLICFGRWVRPHPQISTRPGSCLVNHKHQLHVAVLINWLTEECYGPDDKTWIKLLIKHESLFCYCISCFMFKNITNTHTVYHKFAVTRPSFSSCMKSDKALPHLICIAQSMFIYFVALTGFRSVKFRCSLVSEC